MKLINRIAIFLIIFAITPAFQSCESVSDSLGNINLFSIEEDVRMGKQLNQEIHANPQEYPMLDNQEVDQYLENMLADILQSSDVKYAEDFEYNIQVIDKEVVNAFAAPGGYLYFYTGLLKFCENEATLAG
ncbi:MAG: M48 family metalloprotease, partial [Bacteroidota bacterium]